MSIKIMADLVHHTGSMIRFTTSQLVYLPKQDEYITIILPDGSKFRCKFRRNVANPYIGGKRLIHWIKGFVKFGEKKKVIVEIISHYKYLIYMSEQANKLVNQKKFIKSEKDSLKVLLRKLLAISKKPPKIRHKLYDKVLENRINSNLVKQAFGTTCQVQNCEYTAHENKNVLKYLSEVHHLEHLSHGGGNSPYNLAVVCANHHSIFHRDKSAKIFERNGDDVHISYLDGSRKKWIKRNLSPLHNF